MATPQSVVVGTMLLHLTLTHQGPPQGLDITCLVLSTLVGLPSTVNALRGLCMQCSHSTVEQY